MSEAGDRLPCVQWGDHSITRLVLGHNLLKGTSHRTKALSDEMRDWYAPELGHDMEILRRAEECGINTVLFGGPQMQSLISRHKAAGGGLQWIATVYDAPDGDFEEELRTILAVDPRPIGLVYFGERTDTCFVEDRMDAARERTKRLRDTGLLAGVCSHLPDTMARIESEAWDVDFYMTCFYTVYSRLSRNGSKGKIDRGEERYDDGDRDRMVAFIKRASKPCVAFKVLGAGRNCSTDEDVARALRFAYENIKPVDVVGVGMWQKYKDEMGENALLVREMLEQRGPATER